MNICEVRLIRNVNLCLDKYLVSNKLTITDPVLESLNICMQSKITK